MKKILAIMLAVVFVVMTFASCTKDFENEGQNGSDTANGSDVIIESEDKNDATGDETKNDSTDGKVEDTDNNTETEKPTFNVKESTAGLKYVLNEDKLSYTVVGKGSATAKNIVIDGHNGLPVTRVGYSAFGNDATITSLKLGNYVERIDDYGFSFCSGLTSVTFGENVKYLGDYSFRYCSALTSVELGKNVEVIKYGSFYNCKNLATIRVFGKVRVIEEFAFDKTAYFNDSTRWKNKVLYIGNNLIKAKSDISGAYTVSANTTCIGGVAFKDCTALTSITIPDTVHSIGLQAFEGATKLKTINIGSGVTYIGEKAFYNSGFYNTSANWNNNVLYVGSYLVSAKTGLSGAYTVSTGTKAIADMAFSSCASLTGITIPNSVVYVGEYAFRGCAKLASVKLGSGVKEVGVLAFKDCAALNSITFGSISGWKADKVSISSDVLSNNSSAAMYLAILHSDKVWKRA